MFVSEVLGSVKTFLLESKRVLAVTRKPTKGEFFTIVKVTGTGILIIGAVGFTIYLAVTPIIGNLATAG